VRTSQQLSMLPCAHCPGLASCAGRHAWRPIHPHGIGPCHAQASPGGGRRWVGRGSTSHWNGLPRVTSQDGSSLTSIFHLQFNPSMTFPLAPTPCPQGRNGGLWTGSVAGLIAHWLVGHLAAAGLCSSCRLVTLSMVRVSQQLGLGLVLG